MRAQLILRIAVWLAIALPSGVGAATTWTVTNTSDGPIGVCASNCTLREAIAFAGNGDLIQFAAGVTGTITLGGAGELFIQQNITINGPGLTSSIIDGNSIDLVPTSSGGAPIAAYAQGTVVGGWKCGPGSTSPILAKFLPGSCRG